MADPVVPSWRKPFGALFILALIATWAVLVVSLSHVVGAWPIWGQTVFYVGTGMVWITPLKPLLRWMEGVSAHAGSGATRETRKPGQRGDGAP